MACPICKPGEMREGSATVTLQRDTTTVVIKEARGRVCDNRGEYCLSDATTEHVLRIGEEAAAGRGRNRSICGVDNAA